MLRARPSAFSRIPRRISARRDCSPRRQPRAHRLRGDDPRLQWLWRKSGARPRHIPEMRGSLFRSSGQPRRRHHLGRCARRAAFRSRAYQGHGAVATPHNILITGNDHARRHTGQRRGPALCDETRGYSSRQPKSCGSPADLRDVFDERIADVARQFDDFRKLKASAQFSRRTRLKVLRAPCVCRRGLRGRMERRENLKSSSGQDRYGRKFSANQACKPPLHAVKVTGALFHTQGGLAIDSKGRVRRRDGRSFTNLFAAGGAAAGVSGSTAAGYLSGNGLLTATVLGRLTEKPRRSKYCIHAAVRCPRAARQLLPRRRIAQLDRAPDFEYGGQGFESLPARHFQNRQDNSRISGRCSDSSHARITVVRTLPNEPRVITKFAIASSFGAS